jgi:hypothetical protein
MHALLLVVCLGLVLSGYGALALLIRVTAEVARVVPVAGDVVAVPFEAVGETID